MSIGLTEILKEFLSPYFIGIYLLLLFLIGWQYKRMEDMSSRILGGGVSRRYLWNTAASVLFGLAGGILGSFLLIYIGIDLAHLNIVYLWLIAVLLMLINPRFLCFAYAGGILSLCSLALGYPQLDIPQLLALIAVLHMVESLLILLSGHLHPIPVYISAYGQLRGGFNLQKFWPIPLLALASSLDLGGLSVQVAPSSWWPLVSGVSVPELPLDYVLLPIVAGLGYGEVTTTDIPRAQSYRSARNLLGFSLILLILALASSSWPSWLWIAAVFSPLGHELVIWLGMRAEFSRSPIYVKTLQGIKILAVKPGSAAHKAGLRSGDIILAAEHNKVNSLKEWEQILTQTGKLLHLEMKRDIIHFNVVLNQRRQGWGIIPAPEAGIAGKYLILHEDRIFNGVRRGWYRLKRFLKDWW